MPSEYAPVVKVLDLGPSADPVGRRGRVGNVEVVAAKTGIGTALATAATRRVLDAGSVDHVLVVGIAGGIGATRVGDLILPDRVVDGASGSAFTATPLAGRLTDGTIVTSDELIVQPDAVAR